MKLEVGTQLMIQTALQHRLEKEKKRSYLGISSLGEECDRALYYKFFHPELAEKITPRTQSIFDLGNLVERYVLDLLIESGISVFEKTDEGKQFEVKYGENILGHVDAIVKNIPETEKPCVLEIKSANDSNFKKIVKDGLEIAFHHYYIQLICYLKLFEMNNGIFIMYNKNDSTFYTELIRADNIVAESYLKRGESITKLTAPPERKYKERTHFRCKFCPHQKICWEGK